MVRAKGRSCHVHVGKRGRIEGGVEDVERLLWEGRGVGTSGRRSRGGRGGDCV